MMMFTIYEKNKLHLAMSIQSCFCSISNNSLTILWGQWNQLWCCYYSHYLFYKHLVPSPHEMSSGGMVQEHDDGWPGGEDNALRYFIGPHILFQPQLPFFFFPQLNDI